MKPVIGLTVAIDQGVIVRKGHDYLNLKRTYSQALATAGAVPILLSPDVSADDILGICHAIVIPGGEDLPTSFSNDPALKGISTPTAEVAERIAWERKLIAVFSHHQRPILGVCYGMQLINLHFGGSLLDDISSSMPHALDHGDPDRNNHHEVSISKDSRFLSDLPPIVLVSSSHHQAVDQVAPNFTVAAVAKDGVIEAIEWGNILGVEWHPESDTTRQAVYTKLVEACQ